MRKGVREDRFDIAIGSLTRLSGCVSSQSLLFVPHYERNSTYMNVEALGIAHRSGVVHEHDPSRHGFLPQVVAG
jgi:hypothetical protein